MDTAGVAAADAQSKGHDRTSAVVTTTNRALAALSLIHTLICVQIFQTFDCDKFDAGDEKGSTAFFNQSESTTVRSPEECKWDGCTVTPID